MKIFIQVLNHKVLGWGSTKGNINDIEIEVPNDHEVLSHPFIFRYEDGQLVKDEAYQQQLIQEKQERQSQPSLEDQLASLKKAIDDMILGGF